MYAIMIPAASAVVSERGEKRETTSFTFSGSTDNAKMAHRRRYHHQDCGVRELRWRSLDITGRGPRGMQGYRLVKA